MPKRIQMSRQRPWRADNPDAVIVARPSRWGNPFPVAEYGLEVSIKLFRTAMRGGWNPSLLDQAESDAYWDLAYTRSQDWRRRIGVHAIEQARCELGGLDLACWCPLDQPCHADVLLELANGTKGSG